MMSEFHGTSDSEGRLHGEGVRIHIEPYEPELVTRMIAELTRHKAVRTHLEGLDLQIAAFELLDKDAGEQSRFEAVVYDPDDCRCVRVQGTVAELGQATADLLPHKKRPSEEDFQRGVESVLRHDQIRQLVENNGAQAYQPMPPYIDIESPDGSTER